MDAPPVETILVEPGEPLGPYGAKGAGETPIQAPMAAIANAVHNATGKRIREIPMTPTRVLANL
jgi:CO/xanthine dehydrogenase Mo-binding subunit